jgi:hypothetical protein
MPNFSRTRGTNVNETIGEKQSNSRSMITAIGNNWVAQGKIARLVVERILDKQRPLYDLGGLSSVLTCNCQNIALPMFRTGRKSYQDNLRLN